MLYAAKEVFMTRQTTVDNQQISLFEPLLSVGSSAVTPLFAAPRHTNKATNELYDGLFSEIALSGQALPEVDRPWPPRFR